MPHKHSLEGSRPDVVRSRSVLNQVVAVAVAAAIGLALDGRQPCAFTARPGRSRGSRSLTVLTCIRSRDPAELSSDLESVRIQDGSRLIERIPGFPRLKRSLIQSKEHHESHASHDSTNDHAAHSPVPRLGRSTPGCGKETEHSPRTRFASIPICARRRPSTPRHGPTSRGTAEPATYVEQERDRARVRPRRRSLRLPARSILSPVEPHPHHRRSGGSGVSLPRHARIAGSRRSSLESPMGSARIRVRGSLPCEGSAHTARSEVRSRLRAQQRETPRPETARDRSVFVGMVVRRVARDVATDTPATGSARKILVVARRLEAMRVDRRLRGAFARTTTTRDPVISKVNPRRANRIRVHADPGGGRLSSCLRSRRSRTRARRSGDGMHRSGASTHAGRMRSHRPGTCTRRIRCRLAPTRYQHARGRRTRSQHAREVPVKPPT